MSKAKKAMREMARQQREAREGKKAVKYMIATMVVIFILGLCWCFI